MMQNFCQICSVVSCKWRSTSVWPSLNKLNYMRKFYFSFFWVVVIYLHKVFFFFFLWNFVQEQVIRMLRLTERDETNVREFQRICPEAKARNFGRLFRSPTLFEDAIKCVLLINCK